MLVFNTFNISDGRVAFIIPVDGATNQYLVGIEHKFLVIQWDGEEGSKVKILKELGEVDQHDPTTKINDGKADPKGRVYTGTLQHLYFNFINFYNIVNFALDSLFCSRTINFLIVLNYHAVPHLFGSMLVTSY